MYELWDIPDVSEEIDNAANIHDGDMVPVGNPSKLLNPSAPATNVEDSVDCGENEDSKPTATPKPTTHKKISKQAKKPVIDVDENDENTTVESIKEINDHLSRPDEWW